MDFQPPKGTLDFLPPAGDRLWALYDRAARLAGLYGYRYVETPVFEAAELFDRTSGETSDVVSKETYSFEDRGGRKLTLRPEGTAPVMRAYLHDAHAQAVPFKAFYLTTMYRYARPQAGRYREHRQFGIEVIGEAAPGADVEVVAVGNRFLRELGLSRFRVEVNSIGDAKCRPAYREQLIAYFGEHADELRDEHRERYVDNPLRVLDCKDEACRAVVAGAPRLTLCPECAEHFAGVIDGLRREGIEPVVTPTMVRGLDYYTRTAFEFVSESLTSAQSTLFGGGRYDGLAEALGGPHVPGIGFGMGLERVLLALDEEGVSPPAGRRLDCFVITATFDAAARIRARDTVRDLRAAGLNVDAPFEEARLKHQFRTADRLGARFAVVIGEREVSTGTVTAKRLSDGVERTASLEDAIAWIEGGDQS